jgi:hypothetical protein
MLMRDIPSSKQEGSSALGASMFGGSNGHSANLSDYSKTLPSYGSRDNQHHQTSSS